MTNEDFKLKCVKGITRLEDKIEFISEKVSVLPDLKTKVDKMETKVKHNKYVSYTVFMLFIGILLKLILGV